jgi:hypothetical protein
MKIFNTGLAINWKPHNCLSEWERKIIGKILIFIECIVTPPLPFTTSSIIWRAPWTLNFLPYVIQEVPSYGQIPEHLRILDHDF